MSDQQMKIMPEDFWKERLTPEQYKALRQKGTETSGTGKYTDLYGDGMYQCATCGRKLFSSKSKYDSSVPGLIGWASFSEVVRNDAVESKEDNVKWIKRTEVGCKNCDGHLGHLFPDDTSPKEKFYHINSAFLNFEPKQ